MTIPAPATIVTRVVHKARAMAHIETLRPDEGVLSGNKVTGYSLNVPIWSTCQPTEVCAAACYFAKGPSSWPAALAKQIRLLNSIRRDPHTMAERVISEYDRLKLEFIRWNGGGDLFPESVAMLNHLASLRPDITIWVVTRKPDMAAMIGDHRNVYIHFSLDRASLSRRVRFEALSPISKQYFFSYQVAKDETPDAATLAGASVVFFDGYKPANLEVAQQVAGAALCPLNTRDDITAACTTCRRCFDGSAVAHRQTQVRPIDPTLGSGAFLLAACDLLEGCAPGRATTPWQGSAPLN
jgi:hypothetical protein